MLSLCLAAAMLFGAAPHVAAADGWSVLEQQLDAQLAQDNDTNYNGYWSRSRTAFRKSGRRRWKRRRRKKASGRWRGTAASTSPKRWTMPRRWATARPSSTLNRTI
ncbi:MAG: hypothetical protein V8S89_00015 [Oscillospiraceae bacterium]